MSYKSKIKGILKFCLAGFGIAMVIIVAFGIWVYTLRFSGPDAMEMSDYHPFRSPEAKIEYLRLYDERATLWPVASETRIVETSYGQTFVRISGRPDASPLVLLPGGGGNSLLWAPNIAGLSEHYRTYAVDDIYGYGRSVPTRAMEDSDDIVNWLDELFTALQLGDNINLMGISYGGWQTSQYALRFANRLDKIVLIAPAATIFPLSGEWVKHAILMMIPHRYFLKNTVFWIFEDLVQQDETSRIFVEDWVEEIFVALRCFKFKMLVPPTVLTDQELEGIKVPTLFLVGENEKIYSAQSAVQRLNDVAPRIKTEIIQDCGHDIWILQKETVNRNVLAFLNQTMTQE